LLIKLIKGVKYATGRAITQLWGFDLSQKKKSIFFYPFPKSPRRVWVHFCESGLVDPNTFQIEEVVTKNRFELREVGFASESQAAL
jgi:hypothetical protein